MQPYKQQILQVMLLIENLLLVLVHFGFFLRTRQSKCECLTVIVVHILAGVLLRSETERYKACCIGVWAVGSLSVQG